MFRSDHPAPKLLTMIAMVGALLGFTACFAMASPDAVLLTVKGTSSANTPVYATYTLAALQGLPKTNITTTTTWTQGPQQFEGVLLKTLLDIHSITAGTVIATAINAYETEIPVSDAVIGGPIIAYSLNGAAMSVRDRGPLWVVYPYDLHPDYQTEVVYARSIWQLDRITFAP
jgi:hypothetical protein